MTQLKRLGYYNLKGSSGEIDVDPCMLFVGPNGAGKSTWIEALQLAMNGYFTGRQKKGDAIMQLASSDTMGVAIGLSSGFKFTREFTRTVTPAKTGGQKIEVNQLNTLSPLNSRKPEKNATDMQKRAEDEFGGCVMMLDWLEFDKSDAQKRAMILELVDILDWDKDYVRNWVYGELHKQMTGAEEEVLQAYSAVFDECFTEYPEGCSVNDALTTILVWAKEAEKLAKAEVTKLQGAGVRFVELKTESGETDRGLNELREEVKRLTERWTQAKADLTTNETNVKYNQRRADEIQRLKDEIASLQIRSVVFNDDKKLCVRDIDGEVSTNKTLESLEKYIKSCEAQIQEVNRKDVDELDNEIDSLQNKIERLREEISAKQTEVTTNRLQAEEIRNKVAQVESYQGKCPVDTAISCSNDFTGVVAQWKTEACNLENHMQKAISEAKALQSEANSLLQEKGATVNKKNQLVSTHDQQLEQNKLWQVRVQKAKDTIAEIRAKMAGFATSISEKQTELDRWEQSDILPVQDEVLLRQHIETIENTITDTNAKIKAKEEVETNLKNQQTTQIQLAEAQVRADALKTLVQILGPKGMQGEIIKATLQPIQDKIDQLHKTIGVEERFYFQLQDDRGNEVFWMGWEGADGQRKDYNSLSESERIRLLATLMTCYINKKGVKVRILAIDDFEHLTATNRRKVMTGLKQLVEAGELDNVLLFAAITPPVDACGYTVKDMWKPEELEAELKEVV